MLLEVDNVELYFREKGILNGIYLKAETAKVTGILGRNGSGKSCLLQIIFGSLKPKYKLVRLDKTPYLKPLFQSGRVKYLPQHSYLPKHFKLKTAFKLFNVSWDDFIKKFEEFRGLKNHKPKSFSSGQLRLLETYLILKSNSDIVLLDEPFSHLSPIHIDLIKEIISQEKIKKVIVITDHMYRHIIDAADDIYLLKNGCIKKVDDLLELEDYKYLTQGSLT